MKMINCVLIVDDDPISAFLTQKVCVKVEMAKQVVAFSNGLDALQFISEFTQLHGECPELMILDIHMPNMDGFELIKRIEDTPFKNIENLVLIGLSASLKPGWNDLDSNFNEFLSKPFSLSHIRRIHAHYFEKATRYKMVTN